MATNPSEVTWNPDGTYNKDGKTYAKRTMSSDAYYNYLRYKPGGQLTPQEQSMLKNMGRIYNSPWNRGSKTGAGDGPPRTTYGTYDIEIPNYKGSKAATPATTPTTTGTTTTTTTDEETPQAKARRLAREGAESDYAKYYKDTGLAADDPYGLHSRYMDAFNKALGAVPGNETNINLNTKDFFSGAQTGATTAERNELQQGLYGITPQGWQKNYFADTADDAILQQILDQQSGELKGSLEQQLGRGQISQGAYDYALAQMGNLSSGAMQNLQNIGQGVLSGYRTGLDDMVNNFQNSITNYQLGQQLDPTKFGTDLAAKAEGYKGGMSGDIYRAFGNTQLFDPNSLVAKAGSVVGAGNPPTAGGNPQGTGTAQDIEDRRTIGTSGVF